MDEYRRILDSPRWRLGVRPAAIDATEGLCAYCWTSPATELDHTDYAHLGREAVADVMPTCRSCHQHATDARRTAVTLESMRPALRALPDDARLHEVVAVEFAERRLAANPAAVVVFRAPEVAWLDDDGALARVPWAWYTLDGRGRVVLVLDEVPLGAEPVDYERCLDEAEAVLLARCKVEGWPLPWSRRPATGKPAGRSDSTRPRPPSRTVLATARRQRDGRRRRRADR